MTVALHPRVAAFSRETDAFRERIDALSERPADVDTMLRVLHDFTSTCSLLEDMPPMPAADGLSLSFIGRWAATLMTLAENLSAGRARERAAARRAATRRTSDSRVVASLLVLSVLLNVLLAVVALR